MAKEIRLTFFGTGQDGEGNHIDIFWATGQDGEGDQIDLHCIGQPCRMVKETRLAFFFDAPH